MNGRRKPLCPLMEIKFFYVFFEAIFLVLILSPSLSFRRLLKAIWRSASTLIFPEKKKFFYHLKWSINVAGAPSPKHENRKRVKEERSHNSWRSGRESRSRDNYESSSYDKFSSAGYRAERRTRDDKSESRFHRSEHSRHDDRYSSKHQDRTERSEKTHSRSLKEAVTEYSGRRRDIDDRDRFHRPEERKIEKGSRVDHLEDSSSKKHKSSLFEKPAAEGTCWLNVSPSGLVCCIRLKFFCCSRRC